MLLQHKSVLLVTFISISIVAAGSSLAGTISLAWDPVDHPNLAGYRVYHGTAAGVYPQNVETALSTEVTLTGLTDCVDHFIAVKAFASDESESEVFSNEISGWPRPEITSAAPATIVRGAQLQLTLSGTNFRPGDLVQFSNAGVSIDGVAVNGCGEIVLDISVAGSATLGSVDVRVVGSGEVYGDGAALFAVVADDAAPVLSGLTVLDIGGTSASLTWSTDEPSDGRLFYRRAGETSFVQWPETTVQVTSHSLALTGLQPETSYEYYVTATDAQGNVSTSDPVGSFATLASDFDYLTVEAEAVAVANPLRVVAGQEAFGGAWLALATWAATGSPADPSGTVELGFHLPVQGQWFVWLRLFGADSGSDGWLEAIDGVGLAPVEPAGHGAWQWAAGRAYTLDEGMHTLTLGGLDPGARVDRVVITDDAAFLPSELPGDDLSAPNAPSALVAIGGDGGATLTWTNPAAADLERVIVRYRTDSTFPTSPIDGLPLLDRQVSPGAAEFLEHAGLVNGMTYSYGVFAIDAAGNVSESATGTATPEQDTPPLGQVPNLHRTDTVGN